VVVALTPVPKPPIWVGTSAAASGLWAWNLTEGMLPWSGSGSSGSSGSTGRLLGVAAQSLAVNGSVNPKLVKQEPTWADNIHIIPIAQANIMWQDYIAEYVWPIEDLSNSPPKPKKLKSKLYKQQFGPSSKRR